jgi:tryptophan 7-halogenase
MSPIQKIVVLGAGSAGLMAALAIRRVMPFVDVRVVRSPDIGVIGVGEGSTPNLRSFLFDFLRLDPDRFYAEAQPTWKLGIKFIWGPRKFFNFTFSPQVAGRMKGFPRPMGYYCEDSFDPLSVDSALMLADRTAERDGQGNLVLSNAHAWHVENRSFVQWLENEAIRFGVRITDGVMERAELSSPGHVAALHLAGGERVAADLFIDASGFRAELLGRALGEPWISYEKSLFCDRAVIGGWERGTEPVHPYTTAETMDAGWCWRIDHERFVNRGYVYSSRFISDDEARAEFLRKNPKAPADPRVVRFRSGRFERPWVGNVVGIGNAAGFVEPLEATALMLIAVEARNLVDTLFESQLRPTPGVIEIFNRGNTLLWDYTRDFLAVHYKYNTRLDTPFWRHVRAETPLELAAPIVEFYEENGPSLLSANLLPGGVPGFGYEGFFVMLVGQKAPTRAQYIAGPEERMLLAKLHARLTARAERGLTVPEALAVIRGKDWTWNAGPGAAQSNAIMHASPLAIPA